MKRILVNSREYEFVKGDKDHFIEQDFNDRCTDYFYEFDYILGDYSYGKLRLKGFYDSNNSKVKDINNINYLDKYLKDHCSYGCRYYVLKKKNIYTS